MQRIATIGIFAVALIVGVRCDSSNDDKVSQQIAQGEKQLGDQIRAILKHYQQDDPIGLPGAPIPDPMKVPDMKHSVSIYTMHFKNVSVYGLSKFRIESINSELALMQVSVAISIEELNIRGQYTLASWLSKSSGDFTTKLTGVNIEGLARLIVESNGKLQAENIDMDLTFENIGLDFQNLGLFGSIVQSFINSIGSFIFDTIKPLILQEVNRNIRGELNEQISQLPQYFPNSISPFDMAVAEARKQVSNMGYDPYKIKDYSQSVGIFTLTSTHTWVTGLASFYRMGNITLSMNNGSVYAVMDVGTQEIEGRTNWEISVIGGVLSRAGTVSFTIEYFRVQVNLSQPLDTRKRATLEDLNFELGNIQTRVHGAGTLDYAMEAGVNVLPNLLRNQVMDALEGPIKRRLQHELDKIDTETFIQQKIPEIEAQTRLLKGELPADDVILEDAPPDFDDSPFSDSEENRGPS